jgi:ATP-dependent DNA helicase RecG
MQMLSSELQEIIQQGENDSVEFKEYGVRVESLAKEMVAFANNQGGVILLGINDTGIVTGIPTDVALEEWVMNIVRDRIVPALKVKFNQYFSEDNKIIAEIVVPKGSDKPYQTAGKYYIRVGSNHRLASQSELMCLFQAAGIFHYDANGVDRTTIQNLNFTALEQYFCAYHIDFYKESENDKERLLINTDILNETKQATVGGLLIFGINPERYLPQSGISFAHFAGHEIQSELIDKQNISGPLPLQVDRCLATLKNNLLMPSDIKEAKREDLRLYPPMKVFRELIVNACIHRNYAITGSKIRIFMFSDRIEFMSPGRLPNTVTIDKLKVGVSYASNPILVKFMENLRYIDHLGRGLPMVYQEIRKLGHDVLFKEVGEEFRVIVPLDSMPL